jgi:hypothetical protein
VQGRAKDSKKRYEFTEDDIHEPLDAEVGDFSAEHNMFFLFLLDFVRKVSRFSSTKVMCFPKHHIGSLSFEHKAVKKTRRIGLFFTQFIF